MKISRPSPALLISLLALFISLGGSAYAVSQFNGKNIKPKSIPGNRLKPNTVAGNRLKNNTISANKLRKGSITAAQINVQSLGQVPNAVHADHADTAGSAGRSDTAGSAATATHAITADSANTASTAGNAYTVNGHPAACHSGEAYYGGMCWQLQRSAAAPLKQAWASCLDQGGQLPPAYALERFTQVMGIPTAGKIEFTSDIYDWLSPDTVSVLSLDGGLIQPGNSSTPQSYRCVFPLVR